MRNPRLLFVALLAVLVAAHLCHVGILWEGDAYPLAAAQQLARGKVLYRDVWFDKPPLLPLAYLLWGARDGVALRLAGALYALLVCWIAYGFARDLWSEREGAWAAGLTGFFLVFDFPSAAIPVASDLLMVAPHILAVWMAWKRRPFLAGLAAGAAFWISPKGLLVAAVCALWDPRGIGWMAAGFAAVGGAMAAWLGATGALAGWWEEVWSWGRLYAASPFVRVPAVERRRAHAGLDGVPRLRGGGGGVVRHRRAEARGASVPGLAAGGGGGRAGGAAVFSALLLLGAAGGGADGGARVHADGA